MQSLLEIAQPEFFDIFGFLGFAFILILSIWGLKTRQPFPKWILVILLLIGLLGLIVDGVIVFLTYLN